MFPPSLFYLKKIIWKLQLKCNLSQEFLLHPKKLDFIMKNS